MQIIFNLKYSNESFELLQASVIVNVTLIYCPSIQAI